jgi:hypothetical protein
LNKADDAALPTVRVGDGQDAIDGVLDEVRLIALKHPEAFRAALAALRAEGQAFAQTAEGERWRQRLLRSALLNRLSLLWQHVEEISGEPAADQVTPSALVDSLFRVARSPDRDRILDLWFGGER